MPIEDKMTIDERRKYLRKMQKRYVQADREERARLLDEMEAVTDMHRKSLVRLMNQGLERKPRCMERGETYGSSRRRCAAGDRRELGLHLCRAHHA